MAFILNLFNEISKEKASNNLDRIYNLRGQLTEVGFSPDEVDYMIMTEAGKKDLAKLGLGEIKKIEDTWDVQLDIARKCLDLTKEG